MSSRDIDSTSENVLHDWASEGEGGPDEPEEQEELAGDGSDDEALAWGSTSASSDAATATVADVDEEVGEPEPIDAAPEPGESDAAPEPGESDAAPEPGESDAAPEPTESEPDEADAGVVEIDETPMQVELSHEHAAGDLHIPDGYAVLEGLAEGGRRAVGVVVSRFNGSVTTQLLDGALAELSEAGVRQDAITIMVVPGAFELPLAATALAKTRRFACIVALGCVIRGDTPHFDYVASEAASGLQLAALETGVPVAFGVLTLDRVDQAEARVGKGAEAVRSALEMADLFAHLRAAAAR